VPGFVEMGVVLVPGNPHHIRVGVGQAKFLRFSCIGGPADVVIALSTYSERADPLLFLSLNPDEPPSFQQHDATSFGQWREDAAGNHYVIAKGASPRGGIVGLVNMRHFGGEELDGILHIQCSFIVAFDTLFWDHLRSSTICPVGPRGGTGARAGGADTFCSGHGQCRKDGVCVCDGNFAGPACEHSKRDMVVAAKGRYRFQVATGRYQYFRVRVPPRFPGGYLKVKVTSEQPLVVLVRGDDLPTKGTFELSNFDDWVSKRNTSVIKYEISPDGLSPSPAGSGSLPRSPMAPMGGHQSGAMGRRLVGGNGLGDFIQQLGSGAKDYEDLSAEDSLAPPRGLRSDVAKNCPQIAPVMKSPVCTTESFTQCETSCMACVGCVKGEKKNNDCTYHCNKCLGPSCIDKLSLCAQNVSCVGLEAMRCEAGCGSCMACFDSNDRACSGCRCCIGCLPLAAKCSLMQRQPAEYTRFVFVGLYNHRRYYNDKENIHAIVDISLTEDPKYHLEELPSSWIADLYDPFHDIGSLEITQRKVYPDGQQFIYEVRLTGLETLHLQVRVYRDRMTLLHIENTAWAQHMVLDFLSGPNITHILSSSKAAPKTLFDFDQAWAPGHPNRVEIHANGAPSIWCVVFGAKDGYLEIAAKASGSPAKPMAPGLFALGGGAVLLGGALALGLAQRDARRCWERISSDPRQTLGELTSLANQNSVEDEYLHRGGMGDDGM